jgi:hypothetical protein
MTSTAFSRPTPVARLFFVIPALLAGTISILASPVASGSEHPNEAKNLARLSCGAQIEYVSPTGQVSRVTPASAGNSEAAALIMEDDTVGCALPQGDSKFVIALPKSANVDRFTFLNENAAARGELTVAVSNYRLPAGSSKWTAVEGAIRFENKRLFDLSLLGVEAKFVRLTFHVEKEGRIAAVGLYGSRRLSDYAERQEHVIRLAHLLPAERDQLYSYNFANLYARAHVVRVSSGAPEGASKMIDDDPITSFDFDSGDPHPTVVVELAETERLHRVSTVYDMQPGRVDVYATDNANVDLDHLEALKPIASVVDSKGEGKAAVDFNPQGARYVVLRWTPSHHRTKRAFSVAEIHAFGNVPLALLDLQEAPEFVANVSSYNAPPGEGGADFSNTLGTIADPPTVPPVSP